ncbi:pancreatic lipase-related protein 3-like [Pieris rapae]|uniref:pancreatic lipase-related protein 3-like n=1 Tax=Pieris rapae TaxID=64459 RepID=UPI001E27D41C|nr:pancreatic lipase-related protein 3-like [Pieris rapae]
MGCACAYLPPAKFSFSSIMESALPALHPIVAAGSDRCESVKNILGVTYEQMQQKNLSLFNEKLNIDCITKNGNIKYNFKTSRLKRLLRTRNIIILIHGYLESSNGEMVTAIAPELLKRNIKLFALDASDVISFEYFRSSTYVRFMGEMLGRLLSDVINSGQNSSKIHLIGHSLGAHVAAVAGQQVYRDTGQKLNRITGLDPAGPCFSNVSLDSRLDASDADFVDVIHTNAGILGLNEPVGHKDFYPNDGMSQPGCILSTCDHSRAWELFAESINKPDCFPARKCGNWTLYQNGVCAKNEMSHMGYKSERGSPGIYFLSTSSSAPFGLGNLN